MADKLKLISSGSAVAPIYWRVLQNPQLWNQHAMRTEPAHSPFHGTDDIWARYGDPERAKDGKPHDSYWYEGMDVLGIKPFCLDLMRFVEGTELGAVLITRIPAGQSVKPHIDPGWHARRYQKYGVQLTSAPGQYFCVEDEKLETQPGDIFFFDNSFEHWVTNDTPYERVTMIVCIRKEN